MQYEKKKRMIDKKKTNDHPPFPSINQLQT